MLVVCTCNVFCANAEIKAVTSPAPQVKARESFELLREKIGVCVALILRRTRIDGRRNPTAVTKMDRSLPLYYDVSSLGPVHGLLRRLICPQHTSERHAII